MEVEGDIIFYLWDVNGSTYECFKTLRFYLDENYQVNPTLLVALTQEEGYNLKDLLLFLPYILSSYSSVILSDMVRHNGNE